MRATQLTICISCYNRPSFAKEAIESAIKQQDTEFMLLISDNSTSDAVDELVKKNFPNISYIRRSPSVKASDHANLILSESSSDYVAIIHDDDELEPDYVSEMKALIVNNPGRVCYGSNAVVINEEGKEVAKNFFFSNENILKIDSHLYLLRRWFGYRSKLVSPFPSYVYNKNLMPGFFDNDKYGQYSDYMSIDRALKNGDIIWLNKSIYKYRVHKNQDSTNITFKSYKSLKIYVKNNYQVYYNSSEFYIFRVGTLLKILSKRKKYINYKTVFYN